MIQDRVENEVLEKIDAETLSLLRTERWTISKVELGAERAALVKQIQDANARITKIDALLKLLV